jgi:hypothetical protein
MKCKQLMLTTMMIAAGAFLMTACDEKPREAAPEARQETQAPVVAVKPPAQPRPAAATTTAAQDDGLLNIKEAARKERDMIFAKQGELQTLLERKSDAPLTAQLGEARESAQQIASLKEQIQEHTQRYNGYVSRLKAGNVDTSDVALK